MIRCCRPLNDGGEDEETTIQALLQLQDAEQRGEKLPDIAIFFYNPFHKERNVVDPAWLRNVWNGQKYVDAVDRYQLGRSAQAGLDANGNFSISLVSRIPPPPGQSVEPDEFFRVRMTDGIFFRIANFCKAHAISCIFAPQTATPHDEVITFVSRLGFRLAKIVLDLDKDHGNKYQLLPFDRHPNQLAHREWERRLLPVVKQVLAERTGDQE